MTAVLHDEMVAPPAARIPRPPIGAGGDPLVDAATRLLSIPLRELYAVLWRAGLVEVTA